MAIEDYLALDYYPYNGDTDDDEQPRIVECKRCGKGGLMWEDTDEGWILIDRHGKVHRCAAKVATDDDFGVVGA